MKATHKGQCQVCGKLQMLPDGKLSKHGYEVAGWGFFNGVCTGAAHLPFEQDISLIEGSIRWAQGVEQRFTEQRAALLADKKPATAWVHEYVGSRTRNAYMKGRTYEWREMKVSDLQLGEFGEITWAQIVGTAAHNQNGRAKTTVYAEDSGRVKSINEAMINLNKMYAATFEGRIKEVKQYIKWQQERIKGWKPHPEKLVPIKPESRLPIIHFTHPKHKHLVLCTLNSTRAMNMRRSTEQGKVTCTRCVAGIKAGHWGIKSELS